MRSATRKISAAGGGFTLVELLVVIAVIAILVAVTLPSMSELFRTGSDSQAHNLIAAQLAAARALAIQEHTTAGVHVQLADGANVKAAQADACYAAVVKEISTDRFGLADGYAPQRMPGMMSFLELPAPNVNYTTTELADGQYMTFSIVFNSSGGLKGGNNIYFDDPNFASGMLWTNTNSSNAEPPAKGMLMIDMEKLRKATDRAAYVASYGEVLPINHYTGALMGRERK